MGNSYSKIRLTSSKFESEFLKQETKLSKFLHRKHLNIPETPKSASILAKGTFIYYVIRKSWISDRIGTVRTFPQAPFCKVGITGVPNKTPGFLLGTLAILADETQAGVRQRSRISLRICYSKWSDFFCGLELLRVHYR